LERLEFENKIGSTFLGVFWFEFGPCSDGTEVPVLFTENSTNFEKLYGVKNKTRYVKDAFHDYVVHGTRSSRNITIILHRLGY